MYAKYINGENSLVMHQMPGEFYKGSSSKWFGGGGWDCCHPRDTAIRLPESMLEFGQISQCSGLDGVFMC